MNTLHRIGIFLPTSISRMSSSSRQSKILRKLLVGKDRAKRRWYQDGERPKLQTAANLSNPARQGKNAPRRVHVLNKLFMKHITDQLSTGEVSEAILGRGLEVSHVKVAADFNYVNVFWRAKGSLISDDEMEKILRASAGKIRHELSQLRLMGEVPRINFVRDRKFSSYAEVQDLLDRADYGDDFVPSNWAQLRQDLAPTDLQFDRALPEMRHDVLGLNQAEIMDRIKRTMSKSKQAWERYDEANRSITHNSATCIKDEDDVSGSERHIQAIKLRDEEFAKFLDERRYATMKRHRRSQKNPDFKETYERDSYDDDFDESNDFDNGDYIEEESFHR